MWQFQWYMVQNSRMVKVSYMKLPQVYVQTASVLEWNCQIICCSFMEMSSKLPQSIMEVLWKFPWNYNVLCCSFTCSSPFFSFLMMQIWLKLPLVYFHSAQNPMDPDMLTLENWVQRAHIKKKNSVHFLAYLFFLVFFFIFLLLPDVSSLVSVFSWVIATDPCGWLLPLEEDAAPAPVTTFSLVTSPLSSSSSQSDPWQLETRDS